MNVLSIDFDIIMAPDINLYNDMVGTSPDGERSIETRIQQYPLLNGCRADLNHYQRLVTYILEVIQSLNVEDIRISFSHEDIKNTLQGLEDVHIYSIDHHHDLGYFQPNKDPNEAEDHCSCANWGECFFNKGVITSFTWLNNNNSGPLPPQWENKINVVDLQDVEFNTLPLMNKLFICLSPEWVPKMYHPLFFLILDLINQDKGCTLELH